jgi:hypothetical protein
LKLYVIAGFSGLIVFLGGYVAGKAANPPPPAKEIVKVDTRERDEWRAKAESLQKTIANFHASNQQTIVTRWRKRPDGTAEVEQVREQSSSVRTAVEKVNSATASSVGISAVSTKSERVTIHAPVRPWSVGVLGGVDLRLNKHLGIVAGRDFGPLHLGVWALPTAEGRPAGLVLRLRF